MKCQALLLKNEKKSIKMSYVPVLIGALRVKMSLLSIPEGRAAYIIAFDKMLFMQSTSKKLEGHIASGAFVRSFVVRFDA